MQYSPSHSGGRLRNSSHQTMLPISLRVLKSDLVVTGFDPQGPNPASPLGLS